MAAIDDLAESPASDSDERCVGTAKLVFWRIADRTAQRERPAKQQQQMASHAAMESLDRKYDFQPATGQCFLCTKHGLDIL
jgi:hypothetical protein